VSRPRRTDRGSTVEAVPKRRGSAAGASGGARTRIKLPVDPYSQYAEDAPSRSRRLRGPLIVVGVVIVLFAVIALVNQNSHDSAAKTAAAASSGATPSAGASAAAAANATGTALTNAYAAGRPSGNANGVPIGYPHTSDGSEAAAANYVVAFNSAEMVYSWYRVQLLNAIADPADAATLRSQLDGSYAKVDSAYGLSSTGVAPAGDTFVERAAPVGVSLVSDTGDKAVVSVWVVTVQGVAGTTSQNPVSEFWSTVTVTLDWTRGDWKWVGFTDSDGPAPLGGLQTPAAGQTLQAAVSKYGGLSYGR
jgi:hypothetical protein